MRSALVLGSVGLWMSLSHIASADTVDDYLKSAHLFEAPHQGAAECAALSDLVFIRTDPAVDPADFVADRLERGLSGLFVLGASNDALWAVEAGSGGGGCGEVDCVDVVVREIRFDGRRIDHNVAAGDGHEMSDWPVYRTRSALYAIDALRPSSTIPIDVKVNDDPAVQTTSLSDWIVQAPVASQRKTYLWRIRTGTMMCWCTDAYQLSTHLWQTAQP